jgi:hypothetical protein
VFAAASRTPRRRRSGVARLFALCGRTQFGHTPLHLASREDKLEVVRLLLDKGADKEAKSLVRAPHTRHCRSALRRSAANAPLVTASVVENRRAAAVSAARRGRWAWARPRRDAARAARSASLAAGACAFCARTNNENGSFWVWPVRRAAASPRAPGITLRRARV